jgi:hypothetical protein
MLQRHTFAVPTTEDAGVAAARIKTAAGKMLRFHPYLRGLELHTDGGKLKVTLRVAGHNRWNVSQAAKSLIVRLCRAARIAPKGITVELVLTETTGRELYLGEGRTPTTRRSPTARRAADAIWAQIPWEGEQLDAPDPDPASPGSR